MSRTLSLHLRRMLRSAGTALALVGLVVLPGCWVESIHGLYEEVSLGNLHEDPDLIPEQTLTAAWSFTDDKCTTLLTVESKDDCYNLQSTQQGEGCTDEPKKQRSPTSRHVW